MLAALEGKLLAGNVVRGKDCLPVFVNQNLRFITGHEAS